MYWQPAVENYSKLQTITTNAKRKTTTDEKNAEM
jgi:hypothetical protein